MLDNKDVLTISSFQHSRYAYNVVEPLGSAKTGRASTDNKDINVSVDSC